MNKKFFFILFILIPNCSLNEVVNHHGVHFLDKKQEKLVLNRTNKNDILNRLGPPSTKSTFDNDLWIYLERKESKSSLVTLGRKKLIVNNILILEMNEMGVLVKKKFLNKDDMNKLTFSKNTTDVITSKDSFIQDFLMGLRQKINDPLGQKKIK
tara:strand:+ start:2586 stop:3047 length:462 start_codon:yes stop_codon:yes gene_type:complete